jgi:hypothetical protein
VIYEFDYLGYEIETRLDVFYYHSPARISRGDIANCHPEETDYSCMVEDIISIDGKEEFNGRLRERLLGSLQRFIDSNHMYKTGMCDHDAIIDSYLDYIAMGDY